MALRRLQLIASLLALTAALTADARSLRQASSVKAAHHDPTYVDPGFCEANGPGGTNTACDMGYYGGKVISNPKAYVVLWGDSVNAQIASGIAAWYTAVTNSEYLESRNEYSTNIDATAGDNSGSPGTQQIIGRGVYAGLIQITPGNTATSLDDNNGDVSTELAAQITAGKLPMPDDNTIYMVYFPSGISIQSQGGSCTEFCAYHSNYKSDAFNFKYSVMPDFGPGSGCDVGCGPSISGADDPQLFANECSASSHELIEATTDAEVGTAQTYPELGWTDLHTIPGSNPASQPGEVGDMCNQHQDTITGFDGNTYTVQQIYSQKDTDCATTRHEPQDFTFFANPNSVNVDPGSTSSPIPITVDANGGDSQTVTITVDESSIPDGITLSLDSDSVATGSGTTLTVTAAAGASVKDAQIIFTGTGATTTHTFGVLVNTGGGVVTSGFTVAVAADSGTSVTAGGNPITYTVTTTAIGGFSDPIDLTFTGTLPSDVTADFDSTTINPGDSATLTITAGSTASSGTTHFTITGTSGSTTAHSSTASFVVAGSGGGNDFSLAVAPQSRTVSPTGVATYTVTASKVSGSAEDITLGIEDGDFPTDGTFDYAFAPATISDDGGTSVLTITTHAAAVGSTDFWVGAQDSASTTEFVSTANTINVVVPANDFTLSVAPSTKTIAKGSSGTYTITTAVATGSAESIALTTSALPTGVTGSFNPASVTAGGASVLTLSVGSGAALGDSTFTVTGTATSTAHISGDTHVVVSAPLALPTVSLTAPASGASVSGTVTLSATATVDAATTLSKIEFFVDSALVGTATASPGTASWDSTGVANGTHSITAKATDAAGGSTTSTARSVTVSNTTGTSGDLTVTVTSPSANASVSGTVSVAASAAPPSGAHVTIMSLYIDGAKIADGTSATITSQWNSTGVADGSHIITAEAHDSAGHDVTSAGVTVTVANASGKKGGCSSAGYELFAFLGLAALFRMRRRELCGSEV